MKKVFLALVLLITTVGCSAKEDNSADIVVSSYALQFLTEEIAPDILNVHLQEGSDLSAAGSAKLVMYVSDDYDSNLKSVSNAIEILPLLYTSIDNPIFWVSPKQMIVASEVVYSQILNAFPEYKDELLANYEDLLEQLNDLDRQYMDVYAKSENKMIIDYDSTFEHLQDYGFEYYSIQDNNYVDVVEFFKENNIKKVVCTIGSECFKYENTFLSYVSVVEVNDLKTDPVNGNYFSAQFKNVLLFESLN